MTPAKPLLILLLFIFSGQIVRAQEGTWEVGLMGGGAGYMGDLNQNNPLQISSFSGEIGRAHV